MVKVSVLLALCRRSQRNDIVKAGEDNDEEGDECDECDEDDEGRRGR